jgi:hypothetical protein
MNGLPYQTLFEILACFKLEFLEIIERKCMIVYDIF